MRTPRLLHQSPLSAASLVIPILLPFLIVSVIVFVVPEHDPLYDNDAMIAVALTLILQGIASLITAAALLGCILGALAQYRNEPHKKMSCMGIILNFIILLTGVLINCG